MAEKKGMTNADLENVSGGMKKAALEKEGFHVTPENMIEFVDKDGNLVRLLKINNIQSIKDIYEYANSQADDLGFEIFPIRGQI